MPRNCEGGALPAYNRYGVRVVGAYDPSPDAMRGVQRRFGVENVFGSLDELLDHPEIEVVDIATGIEVRVELIRRALAAGKHVLAQKPLTADVRCARALVEEAERAGLRLAVNQNARWSPAWRVATLLTQRSAIGEPVAVTHLFEHSTPRSAAQRSSAVRCTSGLMQLSPLPSPTRLIRM